MVCLNGFSFIKSVEWLNIRSWRLMEVGAAALQMWNSSARKLSSVTLEHGKSQSAQIFNTIYWKLFRVFLRCNSQFLEKLLQNFLCQNCEHKARAIRTCKRFEEIQMFVKTGFRNRDEHWTLWRKLSQISNLEVGRQFVYLPSLQSLRWKITIFGKLRRLWGSLLRQSVSSNLAETTNVSKWFWSILNLQLVVL